MATLVLQFMIFGINIFRDYLLGTHNALALNYLIICLSIMGFISAGLLDLVMVRSLNFGSTYKYVLIICTASLIALLSLQNEFFKYLYYLSCALLNIIIFSDTLASMSVVQRRLVALFQATIIFFMAFFADDYYFSIPCFFYVAALAPYLCSRILTRGGYVKHFQPSERATFSYWVLIKICISAFLSIYILAVANLDASVETSLTLRGLSYFVTGINILIPIILVGEFFEKLRSGEMIAFMFFPITAIISIAFFYGNKLQLATAFFGMVYFISYVWICKKILIENKH